MSSPTNQVPPKLFTTADLMQYQREQAAKAAEAQVRAAADQAYFDAVRAQFRQSPAEAAAKGQTLTSQTIITNEKGQGTVQSTLEAAKAASQAQRYVPDASLGSRVIDLTPNRAPPPSVAPTGPQTAAQNTAYLNKLTSGVPETGKTLPAGYEYENPTYNLMFGSKRIGDIINEEVARGDRGLYAPRTTYDYGQVKDYLASYGRKSYQVNLNDSLSGGPYHYQVNLNDSISGQYPEKYAPLDPYDIPGQMAMQAKIRGQDAAGYQPPAPSGDLVYDFLTGHGNVYINLGKTGANIATKGSIPYGPEVEGSVYDTLLSAGMRAAKGQTATENIGQLGKDFSDIGTGFMSNVPYSIGSLSGSAGLWIATFGIGPLTKAGLTAVPRAARVTATALRESELVGKASEFVAPYLKTVTTTPAKAAALKTAPYLVGVSTPVLDAAKALKVSSLSQAARATQILKTGLNVGIAPLKTEVQLQKGILELGMKQTLDTGKFIANGIREGARLTAAPLQTNITLAKGITELGAFEAKQSLEQAGKAAASTLSSINPFGPMRLNLSGTSNFLTNSARDVEIWSKLARYEVAQPFRVGGSVIYGAGLEAKNYAAESLAFNRYLVSQFGKSAFSAGRSAASFLNSKIPELNYSVDLSGITDTLGKGSRYTKTSERMFRFGLEQRNAEVDRAFKSFLSNPSGQKTRMKPFTFSEGKAPKNIAQGSPAPLELINASTFDKELAKYASKIGLAAYGGAKLAGLGLGESAASMNRAYDIFGTGLDYSATPNVDSVVKDYIKQFQGGKLSSGVKSESTLSVDLNMKNLLDMGGKSASRIKQDLSNIEIPTKTDKETKAFFSMFTGQGQTPFTIPGMTPLETPMQTPSMTPSQTPTQTPIEVTTTEPPKTPLTFLPPPMSETKRRRHDQYSKFYRKGLSRWRVDPLLNINTKELNKIMGLTRPEKRHRRK